LWSRSQFPCDLLVSALAVLKGRSNLVSLAILPGRLGGFMFLHVHLVLQTHQSA
jgi:hypothetical protein